MDNNEKRKYPRVASKAILEVHHPAFGSMVLNARNASIGGFFAARGGHDLPPADTIVSVYIRRHTGPINEQPARMRVVHVGKEGMGIEFI